MVSHVPSQLGFSHMADQDTHQLVDRKENITEPKNQLIIVVFLASDVSIGPLHSSNFPQLSAIGAGKPGRVCTKVSVHGCPTNQSASG